MKRKTWPAIWSWKSSWWSSLRKQVGPNLMVGTWTRNRHVASINTWRLDLWNGPLRPLKCWVHRGKVLSLTRSFYVVVGWTIPLSERPLLQRRCNFLCYKTRFLVIRQERRAQVPRCSSFSPFTVISMSPFYTRWFDRVKSAAGKAIDQIQRSRNFKSGRRKTFHFIRLLDLFVLSRVVKGYMLLL